MRHPAGSIDPDLATRRADRCKYFSPDEFCVPHARRSLDDGGNEFGCRIRIFINRAGRIGQRIGFDDVAVVVCRKIRTRPVVGGVAAEPLCQQARAHVEQVADFHLSPWRAAPFRDKVRNALVERLYFSQCDCAPDGNRRQRLCQRLRHDRIGTAATEIILRLDTAITPDHECARSGAPRVIAGGGQCGWRKRALARRRNR